MPRSILMMSAADTASRAVLLVGVLAACSPGDVLSVPPPIGVIGSATNRQGAEAQFAGAAATLESVWLGGTGLIESAGLMTDELTYTRLNESGLDLSLVVEDARDGAMGTFAPTGPAAGGLNGLLTARSQLLIAVPALQQYEPPSGQFYIGDAYALMGYDELVLAEYFCAGVPLTVVPPAGGVQYGTPTTMDSLLATAEAHFDSAVKYAGGSDTTLSLAAIGIGRARLDRGNFSGAASAVSNVPVGFVYGMLSGANTSTINGLDVYSAVTVNSSCSEFNAADREGGNGLNFVSGFDPRLVFNTTMKTCDGGTWYYPTKFGLPSTFFPIATGVEAQLIAIEAELHGGNVNGAMADLNTLRSNGPSTYLKVVVPPMVADSMGVDSLQPTADTALSILFRERAFWQYGLGTRLGDMRRLIRQYGRNPETVFPTGTYVGGESSQLPTPIPTYGTDVSFMIPTPGSGWTPNPYYLGCTSPPSTA